jgi:hypothetical protein
LGGLTGYPLQVRPRALQRTSGFSLLSLPHPETSGFKEQKPSLANAFIEQTGDKSK